MTILYRDDVFLLHDTGMHPENAGRLRAVNSLLDSTGLASACKPGVFSRLPDQAIAAVHDLGMIERARQAWAFGGAKLDADTVVCPASFDVALAAAGACVAAVNAVLEGADKTALCLVRPPGHHANAVRSMGFCLFNNIALAAHHARAHHQLDRILIVDWDVHHGNGTQDIWYRDGSVFFLSVHRYGGGFYPGTGPSDETGSGPGLGHTLNVPLRLGITRREYMERFSQALESAAEKCRPQLVLVSAGFDAHHDDPVGALGLETEDFGVLTERVLDVADAHCAGRLISCLEGGYHPQALAESAAIHLDALLKRASPA